jgi:hypothetical protein
MLDQKGSMNGASVGEEVVELDVPVPEAFLHDVELEVVEHPARRGVAAQVGVARPGRAVVIVGDVAEQVEHVRLGVVPQAGHGV